MKIAIIGGGACGIMLGSILKKQDIEYTIFEKTNCARKLLASGNGKANLANRFISLKNYHHNSFAFEIVKQYQTKLFNYFKELNLYLKEDSEGRIYPLTESSLSVLNCIGVDSKHVIENITVTSLSTIQGQYYINNTYGPFDKVVCATGSIASFLPKKQIGFNNYLKPFNLKMVPFEPSLVGFRSSFDSKRITGVRVKCRASLLKDKKLIASEDGEIIFKVDGISGICIMNLSSYYAHLKNKENCEIALDLIPDISVNIVDFKQLNGLIHPKLVAYFESKSLKEINHLLHTLTLPILGTYDYEFAQVVKGGISLEEVNSDLSLKKDSNIFVSGEMLDVDGVCGGYNLMFAFCCALKIGEKICDIK